MTIRVATATVLRSGPYRFENDHGRVCPAASGASGRDHVVGTPRSFRGSRRAVRILCVGTRRSGSRFPCGVAARVGEGGKAVAAVPFECVLERSASGYVLRIAGEVDLSNFKAR